MTGFGEKQIPRGNDRKKGPGEAEADPYGMTARKAKTTTKEDAETDYGWGGLGVVGTSAPSWKVTVAWKRL